MRPLAALLALAVAAPAAGQSDGPYKLVITWYQNAVTVIDYPSLPRCQRAATAVNERMRQRASHAGLPAESADIAFCIPG